MVCIEGDSAFGFSGMELETAVRYGLPIVFVVINNNGIYSGIDSAAYSMAQEMGSLSLRLPPTSLLPGVRYDKLITAFGGEGVCICGVWENVQSRGHVKTAACSGADEIITCTTCNSVLCLKSSSVF